MSARIHLLLDLENVQPTPAELELVRGSYFRLWVIHGPQRVHITPEREKAWEPLGSQVRFVQSTKVSRNSLDLHIALCIGEAAERDRLDDVSGRYVIISRDKGFDAMFGYLDEQGTSVIRVQSLTAAICMVTMLQEATGAHRILNPSVALNVVRGRDAAREDAKERPRVLRGVPGYLTAK
jgi:hypothetical protein